MAKKKKNKKYKSKKNLSRDNNEEFLIKIIDKLKDASFVVRVKSNGIQEIVSILTIIMAILAFLVNYMTLKELQDEREQTNKPIIVAEAAEDYFVIWPYQTTFSINLYNIGDGVAKNIKIEQNDADALAWAKLSEKNGGSGIVSFYHQLLSYQTLFLLPKANNQYKLRLPEGYASIYNEFMNMDYYDNVPDLNLKITYEDNSGKVYVKKYILKFNLFQYMEIKECKDTVHYVTIDIYDKNTKGN